MLNAVSSSYHSARNATVDHLRRYGKIYVISAIAIGIVYVSCAAVSDPILVRQRNSLSLEVEDPSPVQAKALNSMFRFLKAWSSVKSNATVT